MSRPLTAHPFVPADERLVELALEGIDAWYRLHVGGGETCGCNLMGAEVGCNVGEALYRLSSRARAGQLDLHKRVA